MENNTQLVEHFPEVMELEFKMNPDTGKVITLVNKVRFGDELSDNSYSPDFYRYHDVFHFSFATFLDWSPCVRHLLKCKRKSNPIVDEVEDGARARSLEEGISALIFEEALSKNYFEEEAISDNTVDFILRSVQRLEVRGKTKEEWKHAIGFGYKAFRYLRENNGGSIHFNKSSQSASFGRS